MTTPSDPTATIRAANDRFRQNLQGPGRVLITQGIQALPADAQDEVLRRVRGFEAFTEDNDPYGEHDFGRFELQGHGTVFWKIDLYDPDYRFGSADPVDPAKTRRVLTIMKAEEY